MTMDPEKQEKVKPFRLVKYFTFTSLIFIFIGTVALAFANIQWARQMQLKKSEAYALSIIDNLNRQIFTQFILPAALKYGKIQLREKEQFDWMDTVVRSTLHSFKVEMIHIYDLKNVISYSFDPSLVGKKNVGGAAYEDARKGKVSSKLAHRGSFIEIFTGFPKESTLTTISPLRAQMPLSKISGPVAGVIEIVQDLSEDYHAIFRFQIRVLSTSAVVMGILFLIMLNIVRRGEGIIEARARERIRLKEQLSRAEHLSSLGEMVAAVSHEIRNPLGIIKSSADLLKKKQAAVGNMNALPDIIVEESTRLNAIITDFLNFARPKTPNLSPCRLEEVIEKTVQFLGYQLEQQGCRVETRFAEGLPEILADAAMLHQAFLNLLINALQAMPQGGTVRVTVASKAKRMIVAIEDDGPGVPEEFLSKIWSPFFTTKEKGTGLGLGIVKAIVESHEGRIRIENRSAGGAVVTLDLPVRPEVAAWKPS